MLECVRPIEHVFFFPGIGFRPVKAKWVKDAHGELLMPFIAPDADVPYESKYTPLPVHCKRSDNDWQDALALFSAKDVPVDSGTLITGQGVPDDHPLSAVPLPDAGTMMILAIATLVAAKPAWNAMGRFADWFTAERGTGPGKCGWP